MNVLECDVAVVGGGLGGCAAALSACRSGLKVVMTEPTTWIGGQMTSQAVSALDEHDYIEVFGGTAAYYQLRDGIRAHYHNAYALPASTAPLNPGGGWVSRLCFDPRIGLGVLRHMLHPYVEAGQLTILLRRVPVGALMDGNRVREISVRGSQPDMTVIRAAYFIDATELGDLLPLTQTAYVTGAEAQVDTGEAGALPEARPAEVQSFTYGFVVEFRPGESHIIPKPAGYEYFRDSQPYSLTLHSRDGSPRVFRMFDGDLPFWTYRRIHDGRLLGGHDLALINWHSNDYFGRSIIDVSPDERRLALDEAKRLSLGFLYWLQTECPRDDGGRGYPELLLRSDVLGTDDGLSMHPYIRESRRILSLKRIIAHDITADHQDGARAKPHLDSVGIGWYFMDLHPCVGNPTASLFQPTKPFQIPLGACLPRDTVNLLAASKNIGTTHLSNGAYRLHPVEWNIGESVGLLAAFCLDSGCTPRDVWEDPTRLWRFQYQLVTQGIPIFWSVDVPLGHQLFVPTQLLLVRGLLSPAAPAYHRLELSPDLHSGDFRAETRTQIRQDLAALGAALPDGWLSEGDNRSWDAVCTAISPLLVAVLAH